MIRQLLRLPGVFRDMDAGQLFQGRPQHLYQRRIRDRHRMQATFGIIRNGHQLPAQGLGQALQQQRDLFTHQSRHDTIDHTRRQLAEYRDRYCQRDAVILVAGREVIPQWQPGAAEFQPVRILHLDIGIDISGLQVLHAHVQDLGTVRGQAPQPGLELRDTVDTLWHPAGIETVDHLLVDQDVATA